MKHHLPTLDSLKAFEAAARHLSFTLAADELCISKGAISYQIRKLEEEIKCTLFKRSVRQVFLTEAGQSLLQTTKGVFSDLEETLSHLQGVKQQADVSVAASTYVAARWLSPRISLFSEANPNINIVLQHSVNSSEFKLGDVDLAIRWGPCKSRPDKNRFAEIAMSLFPVISPKILLANNFNITQQLTINAILEEPFKSIPLLCEDRKLDTWNEWFETNISQEVSTKLSNPRRIISDANVRVQAAIDGQGFILADDLMLNEINNGLLNAPFKEKLTGYGYAFYASSNRIYTDNVLILKDWIVINT